MKTHARLPSARTKSRKSTSTSNLPKGIIAKKPAATETIVYGSDLTAAVSKLKNDLANSTSSPHALLFGAPGLGKSATVLQLAHEIKRPFWWVQVEEFAEQVETKGAYQFRAVFEAAQESGAVLVFEDFDSFLKKRDEGEDAVAIRRIVAAWLSAMDDFKLTVACLATTNISFLFDQAIMRRFDRLLYFKRLTDRELEQIIKMLLKCESLPPRLISEASQLSPAEITDLARQLPPGCGAEQELSQLIEERLRAIKIAGMQG